LKLNFIEQISRYFSKLKKKYHKKFGVFFIFIVIATFLWFLNALSKEYTTTISYPVRYTNFPKDKILISKLPKYLDFRISSFGFTLLSYKINTTLMPIVFDVNSFSLRNSASDNETYFITTKPILKDFGDQLSSEIELIDILQDTLFFKFSHKVKKNVVVKANINFAYEKQFMQKGRLLLEPDSIEISGPENIIDTIEYVQTKFYKVEQLSKNYEKNIQIEKIKNIKYSHKRILATQNVEKYTEENISIPVAIENIPDSLSMKTFPNKITISYLVGLSDYENVRPDQFEIIADYNSIDPGETKFLNVFLKEIPQFIKVIKFYPRQLEFIIERNKNFGPTIKKSKITNTD